MANQFSFQMSEDFLHAYAAYLKQIREANPGKSYKVTISIDLFPDGIGYEASSPQITIDEDKPDSLWKPEGINPLATWMNDDPPEMD